MMVQLFEQYPQVFETINMRHNHHDWTSFWRPANEYLEPWNIFDMVHIEAKLVTVSAVTSQQLYR